MYVHAYKVVSTYEVMCEFIGYEMFDYVHASRWSEWGGCLGNPSRVSMRR